MASTARKHQDYAIGFDDGWYDRPPIAGASADYTAGFEAAQAEIAMCEKVGLRRIALGIWVLDDEPPQAG